MKKWKHMCWQDRVYLMMNFLFLGIFTFLISYVLIYVISCSLSSPGALVKGKVKLFPVEFSLMGYEAVFRTREVWIGFRNSILYTLVGTVLSVAVAMMGAFPLTRREFVDRKFFTMLFTVTMFVGGGLIPGYLVIKRLHMVDTMWALIVPGLFSAWSIVIARTFIQSNIPEELYEAAAVDGCGYIRYLTRVVVPLSKAVMAVLALNYATGMWNSYFSAMVYLNDSGKYPLQIVLRNILLQNTADIKTLAQSMDITATMERQYLSEVLKYALIVVSSIPLLVIYPFIQKYFMKGVMVGSVKG